MTHVVGSVARAVFAAGLLSTLAAPVPAATAAPNQFAQASPAPAAPAAPVQPAARSHRVMHSVGHTRTQLVEIMISNMRTRLHITQAEQPQFDAVADVMRANAKAMETLLADRAHDTDRSAVASVRWYGRLTDAHAAGLKNFAPAFETLYATLSESQRKTADAMFQQLAARPFTPKSS